MAGCGRPGLALAAAIAAAVLLAGCGKPEPLRVGVLVELGGRHGELGEAIRDGLALAADDLRARGVLGERPVEFLVRGTGEGADGAARAAGELAAARVEAIVGPATAAMADAARPVAERAGIVLLTPSGGTARACGRDDLFFCFRGTAGDSGEAHARRAMARGLRRIAIAIGHEQRAFVQDWLTDFRAAYERAGGQVPAALFFRGAGGDSAEAGALVQELLRSRPDAVLVVAPAADTAGLARRLREARPGLALLAAGGESGEALAARGGAAVEGMMLVDGIDRQDGSPRFREFRERHLRQFGREPGAAAVLGFDAGVAVLEAMARRPAGMPLKEALTTLGPFPGLQQPVRFDARGDAQRKPYPVVIRAGRLVTEP